MSQIIWKVIVKLIFEVILKVILKLIVKVILRLILKVMCKLIVKVTRIPPLRGYYIKERHGSLCRPVRRKKDGAERQSGGQLGHGAQTP